MNVADSTTGAILNLEATPQAKNKAWKDIEKVQEPGRLLASATVKGLHIFQGPNTRGGCSRLSPIAGVPGSWPARRGV